MKLSILLVAVVLLASVIAEEIDEIIRKAAKQDPRHHGDRGNVVSEGDIIYSPEEWEFINEHAVIGGKAVTKRYLERSRRKAIIGKRWPGGVIKFDFKDTFSLKSRKVIAAAMSDYQAYTCLTFQAAESDQDNRISFTDGPGCQSHVGMKGRGSQRLHLSAGCRTKGTVIHEMGHAVGWEHEQARPDRDDYVTIVWKNVENGFEFNFNKIKKGIDLSVGYDLKSIMHYGPLSFSKDKKRKKPTIKTKDPKYQDTIGQRDTLSFLDIKMANIMYKCNSQCPKKSCPKEGFLGKDCKCWCPTGEDVSPAKHCGGDVIKSEPQEIKGLTDYKSDCEDKEGVDCLTWYGFCKNPFWRDEMKKDCPDTCGMC